MIGNHLVLCLLGLSTYFVVDTVGTEAIVGGDKAGVDQFPYQVTLFINRQVACGGGLIGNRHALTAANCVINVRNIFKVLNHMSITVGANNLKSTSVRIVKEIEIENIYVPKNYTYGRLGDDIAVLRLKKLLNLNYEHRYLKKLTLPHRVQRLYSDDVGKIAGFGWNWVIPNEDEEFGKNNDYFLHYTNATIINNSQCNIEYAREPSVRITDKLICARVKQSENYQEDRGVCKGDTGSPLVVNTTTVVAILIRKSSGCAERNNAAVYTRVQNYLDFIRYAVRGLPHKDVRQAFL